MNVHEYQGKEILRRFGVATPRGVPCFSVADADAAARELGGKVWVVKAQIHAGGRGKGGGVKVAKSLDEVHRICRRHPGHDPGHPSDGSGGPASSIGFWWKRAPTFARSFMSGWWSTAARSA